LQSSLTKYRPLHTTLGIIAVECGRKNSAFSTVITEADFGK